MRSRYGSFAVLALASMLAGCRAGAIEAENDRLRAAAIDAEERIAALEAERDELRSRVSEAGADRPELEDADDEAIPRLAGIEIRDLSGLIDEDRDGRPEALRIWVRGYDGRRRGMQLAGPLEATAAVLGDATHPTRDVGTRSLAALEVRDAYRSSPLGTHYVVEIELEAVPTRDAPLAVRVVHLDLRTGARHEAATVLDAKR